MSNEIVITGDPATPVELSVAEHIEIKSSLVIRAAPGPGFHQAIIGNNTTFVVRAGGVLSLQNLRLSGFNGTPLHVEKALIPGRGVVRGVLNATDIEISGNHGPNAIYQTMGIANMGGEVFLNVVNTHRTSVAR